MKHSKEHGRKQKIGVFPLTILGSHKMCLKDASGSVRQNHTAKSQITKSLRVCQDKIKNFFINRCDVLRSPAGRLCIPALIKDERNYVKDGPFTIYSGRMC